MATATSATKGANITNFNTGILSIESLEGLKDAALPMTGKITPSDEAIESFLNRIFQLPTVRHQLLRRLKPRLSRRRVLSPNIYYAIGDAMEAWLKKLEEGEGDEETKGMLREAAEFFKQETELRDMLYEFMLALQQG